VFECVYFVTEKSNAVKCLRCTSSVLNVLRILLELRLQTISNYTHFLLDSLTEMSKFVVKNV
jgi:hypothetical protein